MPEVPTPPTAERKPRARRTTGTSETTATGTPPPPPRRSPSDTKLRESIQDTYGAIGIACGMIGEARGDVRFQSITVALSVPVPDEVTGQMVTGAERFADEWMVLADRDPRVKRMLQRFTEGSAAAKLAMMHLPLVLPFLPGLPGLSILLGVPTNGNGTTPA